MAASAAGARARCTPDKFWRVSLGTCVSKRAQPQHYTVRFGVKRVKPERTRVIRVPAARPKAIEGYKKPTKAIVLERYQEPEKAEPEMSSIPWPTEGRSFNQLPRWERK
jgi:hypothetical protein